LKAIIRIQIDAGVAGVHLDEADLPIFATGYGGCFCKDCMKLFRAYLQALPSEELPEPLRGTDLETFHYGTWLLERGYDFKSERHPPLLYSGDSRLWRSPHYVCRTLNCAFCRVPESPAGRPPC